ncbi:NAD(P)H-dependent oxidoreductase [Pseudodonghicola xiamenensis]|uniref:NAD(P)H dehydrogenase (Quinone) n=1 Tax=Pseudodonghicola xiamenensis TaxID=337702 RepID=A0A8J3HAJ5_9RHOB|nr:NAD(P)H-dependent oxidoreductase [Pseudodonghicola xiamenensis]GHH00652.1 NAD(P)H dehydrogenase (quinone) [Pseudodonghicola xiamenensis]
MSPKRILILNGHPAETSISRQIAQSYAQAAEQAGHSLRVTHLAGLSFDPDFGFGGYRRHKPLEPDLEQFLADLAWCDHFVLVTPMWWGGLPAKLKGLIDRSFLPGRTFDTRGKLPKPLLKGRSGRVILTSDSPWWYFRLLHRPLYWQLKRQILGFVGLKPVRISHFAQASHPTREAVEGWLADTRRLAGRAV